MAKKPKTAPKPWAERRKTTKPGEGIRLKIEGSWLAALKTTLRKPRKPAAPETS